MKLTDLKENPDNPRLINNEALERLIRSIKEFPKMLVLRPIIVNKDNMVLGGNMRLKALKALNYEEIPENWIKRAENLTKDEIKRFIIVDNLQTGTHDWEVLSNDWDTTELNDWGLEIPANWGGELEEPPTKESADPDPEETTIFVSKIMLIRNVIGKNISRMDNIDISDAYIEAEVIIIDALEKNAYYNY